MIKAQNVSKMFGSKLAVDNVSFQVSTGEVLGFLGPNGAGKSTTMKMLTGYLPMSSGCVYINGHDMEQEPILAKKAIGYLPENAPAYSDSSVEGFLNFIAEAKGLSGDAGKQAVEKALHICQLEKVRQQTIDTLSKGYRHRTCFAQAILCDPKVLVLDEPTDGLDPNQKQEMRKLIREMGKNKAIIVSTHILEEVEAICTRVIIIDKGKIVFNGTPAELRQKSPEDGVVKVHVKNVSFADFAAAVKSMPETGNAKEVSEDGTVFFAVYPRNDETAKQLPSAVKNLLDKKGWDFDELRREKGRLDQVFHSITSAETGEKELDK